MSRNLKEEIYNFISDKQNYKNLLNAAYFITRDDTANDLLNDVLYNILSRKIYSDKVENCSNFYNYIVKAMKIQYISKNSEYYKLYVENKNKIYKELKDEENEYSFIYEEILDYLTNNKLFKDCIKNLNYKVIFLDYFYTEYNLDISNLSKEEIDEIRKISYQKIANKYNISKDSVRRAIKSVLKKIKRKYGT